MEKSKKSSNRIEKVKKRKREVQTNEFHTYFENLSNEILYEILEYLDIFHIYQAFSNLNQRFRNFLIYSNLPIQINLSSISKSIFEHYYTDIILSNQHRIRSICIANLFSYSLDLSLLSILFKFQRLERLVLKNIPSNYLNDISLLSNLTSLVINSIDEIENVNQLFLQIFRLSKLKYCQILSNSSLRIVDPLPFALIDQYSTLEQLVIKDNININYLYGLLSYVPKLHRLAIGYLYDSNETLFNHSIRLNFLTHLFIKLSCFQFDQFELLIQNLFPSIEVLHISVQDNIDYLNAQRWEQLIRSYAPYLHIFDIQCHCCYVINPIEQVKHETRLKQFNTSFWLEKRWFFTYEDCFRYRHHFISFYSTNPYRKKNYKFNNKMNKHNDENNHENNFRSVRDVYIFNDQALTDCLHHFPNATNLILKNIFSKEYHLFLNNLKSIIPLQNLTNLFIYEDHHYSLENLIELLLLTSNLRTLNIHSTLINQKELLTIQSSENYRLVSNKNMIQNLMIKQINDLEVIKLLSILFPRLECFTIEKPWRYVKELIQLLLSSSSKTNHLFYLCISNENKRLANKVDTLIQGGKILNNYFIKSDYPKIHLWW